VIHILEPERRQRPGPSRTARVRMPAGFEPKSGSVRPKHPIASPRASLGSHASRCASVPYVKIGHMTSEPCTDAKLRSAESPRSSSYMRRPCATDESPAQPYRGGSVGP
jgi:hypothetical protein